MGRVLKEKGARLIESAPHAKYPYILILPAVALLNFI